MYRSQGMAFPPSSFADPIAVSSPLSCEPLSTSRRRALGVVYHLRIFLRTDQPTPVPLSPPGTDTTFRLPIWVSRPSSNRGNRLAQTKSGRNPGNERLVCDAVSFNTMDESHTPRDASTGGKMGFFDLRAAVEVSIGLAVTWYD